MEKNRRHTLFKFLYNIIIDDKKIIDSDDLFHFKEFKESILIASLGCLLSNSIHQEQIAYLLIYLALLEDKRVNQIFDLFAKSNNYLIRLAVYMRLYMMGDKDILPLIKEYAEYQDPKIRCVLIDLASYILSYQYPPDDGLLDIIIGRTQDQDKDVARNAILSLRTVRSDLKLKPLFALSLSDIENISTPAITALRDCKDISVKNLIKQTILGAYSSCSRDKFIELLGYIGDLDDYEFIKNNIHNFDDREKEIALDAMGRIIFAFREDILKKGGNVKSQDERIIEKYSKDFYDYIEKYNTQDVVLYGYSGDQRAIKKFYEYIDKDMPLGKANLLYALYFFKNERITRDVFQKLLDLRIKYPALDIDCTINLSRQISQEALLQWLDNIPYFSEFFYTSFPRQINTMLESNKLSYLDILDMFSLISNAEILEDRFAAKSACLMMLLCINKGQIDKEIDEIIMKERNDLKFLDRTINILFSIGDDSALHTFFRNSQIFVKALNTKHYELMKYIGDDKISNAALEIIIVKKQKPLQKVIKHILNVYSKHKENDCPFLA
ncbi:MAG: hypothetical protein NZM04_01025 [Methylacidiphilales bacterium]|nr:hypothetical protein [Candidatus Methylacidiphilales bacterium]